MSKYGDADKEGLFTELGFNDEGNGQVYMLKQMFDLVKTMPQIKTVQVFRLFIASGQTGDNERRFCMFKGTEGNFAPPEKARVMQQLIHWNKSPIHCRTHDNYQQRR